jgi:hypothetical protein
MVQAAEHVHRAIIAASVATAVRRRAAGPVPRTQKSPREAGLPEPAERSVGCGPDQRAEMYIVISKP